MQAASRTIAIIGGGFCGTVLAANLLRRAPAVPTRILLIERRLEIGCGVAYAPRSYPFSLNVAAGRMSATTQDATQLIQFAQRYQQDACADSYLPRQLYGEYLREFLNQADLAAPRHVQLHRVRGEVTLIRPVDRGGPVLLHVGERRWLANQVVLACGDPPPVEKEYAADVGTHPAYVRDPHRDEGVQSADNLILLIGTGLTMVDSAVAAAEGHPKLRIFAMSRHGLLPQPQRDPAPTVLDAQADLRGLPSNISLRRLVATVRELTRTVQDRGGDWREVVARLRDIAPAIWRSLGESERRRFLRHVRVYWDVHRHRMPPAIAERVAAMRASGQLQVHAGSIRKLRTEGRRIAVLWRPRGRSDTQELRVDRVVECSGSDRRLERTADVLLRQLLDDGIASSDATGLGLRTGKNGALIDASGRAAAELFYLGPMLRAAHWEATAVRELRLRAEELAAELANREPSGGALPAARVAHSL
jgi:uncharacterized NAD(P)/FAD-binding protein YdhS